MTDHVHGEDSYLECDYYTVVYQHEMMEMYPVGHVPDTECYCGADAAHLARVAFHEDTTDQTPGDWPTSFSRNVKVHRCGDHNFEVNGED